MATSRNDLKNYFLKGKKPTEGQFGEWIDAFYHLDENAVGTEGISVDPAFIKTDRPLQVTSKISLVDSNGDPHDAIEIATNGNKTIVDIMTVKSDGNVGIGVSNPQEKLQVSGNLSLKKFHGIGSAGVDSPELIFEKGSSGIVTQLGGLSKLARVKAEQEAFGNQGAKARLTFTCHYNQGQVIVLPGGGGAGPPTEQPVLSLESTGNLTFQAGGATHQVNGLATAHGDLTVLGRASKPGGGQWTATSDVRVKEAISSFKEGLDVLKKLNPVRYKYNGKAATPKGSQHIGLVAQEVQKVFPEMVSTHRVKFNKNDEDQSEVLMLDASPLTYLMMNAIMELDQRLSKLEAQLK